ncbi:uncharacterized protein EAE97_003336 [Botrytis byssoidea]|uniref:Rhodopsin domain-containing protein n=1 Tax=Botrytis byssoidea TaxID=139641 RepID=A0A9P5IV98_9HELO|nr:uncharacterized protein EAE97_003336 [Botrytis byssoidea]KAF7949827.1 hypothetical protein EAE97_003336 [Botrytis byssoidea]
MSTAGVFHTLVYPGVNLDANEGPKINSVSGVFIGISLITIFVRVFSRWWTKIEFWVDDYLILIGAAFSIAYSALLIFEVQHNYYGQHIGKMDIPHLMSFVKGLYVATIMYSIALTFSKPSLLALYWRIFRVPKGQMPFIVAAAVNIAWMTAAVLAGIFLCVLIASFEDATIEGKCINYPVFFLSNEAFSIALDIVVLLMPVYFISSIEKSLSHRISISSTFLVGLIVTILSYLRLWRLVHAEKLPGPDPSFDDVDAGHWAATELNTWVLVASIPMSKPIIVKILKDRKARQSAASGNHADYSKSISTNKGYERSRGNSFPSTTSGDQLDLVERCAIRENSSQNEMELDVRG